MSSVILQSESLNLPEIFAVKLRGKKVELIENGDNIMIKPIHGSIAAARGMLKGGNFNTHMLMEQKKADKDAVQDVTC